MRSWKWFSAAALALAGCIGPQEELSDPPPVEFQTWQLASKVSIFRDLLSPYGEWFEAPDVGWVWRPDASVVGKDFEPYLTGGRWLDSDHGWVFETDWPWGQTVFHFGRWFVAPTSGWVWWPDDEWAPAWVDWRWGEGFIGWAPEPPSESNTRPAWNFVRVKDFVRPDVARAIVPPERASELVGQTDLVGERVAGRDGQWSRGPTSADVEQVAGKPAPRSTQDAPPTGQPARPSEATATPR